MPNSEFEKITPADIDISSGGNSPKPATGGSSPTPGTGGSSPTLGTGEARRFEHYQRRNSRILWAIFAVLLFLAGGVVFFLPRLVSPPAPGELAGVQPAPAAPARTPAAEPISPYEEAQRLEQRENAQNALAQLLEVQDALEEKQVESWAGDDFTAAVERAQAGDVAYREQNYLQARVEYERGLSILEDIQGRAAEVFNDQMATGFQAIEAGDSEAAVTAFELAQAIDPSSREADQGLARALNLDQVLALLEEGRGLHENNQLEAARERYRQARGIDGEHAGVAQALETVNRDIVDRDFANQMSRGYAALESNSLKQAVEAFQKALGIKPNSGDAQAALKQAQDRTTSEAINDHLTLAREHEREERWQQALDEYNQALGIDPNVVAAVTGRNKAESRLNLDTFLKGILAAPLRLAEQAVYEQALQIFDSARALPDAGPRLEGQLLRVGGLLDKARRPVTVSFQSDGETQVTLYRVADLGSFTSHSMALTPGSYTVVGIREGYRDVREEFIVPFEGKPPVVTVVTTERIL